MLGISFYLFWFHSLIAYLHQPIRKGMSGFSADISTPSELPSPGELDYMPPGNLAGPKKQKGNDFGE